MSYLLFFAVIAIGVVGYYLGKSVGSEQGFNRGFMEGHRHGQKKWIEAMERRRGSDDMDEVVRIIERNHPSR